MTDMTAPPEPENGRCPRCGVPLWYEHLTGYGCPSGIWEGHDQDPDQDTVPGPDGGA